MPIESTNNIVFDFLTEPRFRIGRHVLLIVMVIGYTIGSSMYVFENHTGELGLVSYVYTVSLAVVSILFAYFNIYYLAPRLLLRGKHLLYFVIILLIMTLYVIAKQVIEYYISLSIGIESPFRGIKLLSYVTNITFELICVSSTLITLLLRLWLIDSKQIVDLEGRKLKSSIEELKDQINPVFLFNIIQHASDEVKREPHKASELIMYLSELLRYQLYDCKRAKVILKSDIDFVHNYLSLAQQVESNFSYAISIEGDINRFVPPFQFMPFIRKILRKHPGNVLLHYMIDESSITLTCSSKKGVLESNTIKL